MEELDCSPTNRERELGLDRRETGWFYPPATDRAPDWCLQPTATSKGIPTESEQYICVPVAGEEGPCDPGEHLSMSDGRDDGITW